MQLRTVSLECQILSLFDLSVISEILVIPDVGVEEVTVAFGLDEFLDNIWGNRRVPVILPVVQSQFQDLSLGVVGRPMNLTAVVDWK